MLKETPASLSATGTYDRLRSRTAVRATGECRHVRYRIEVNAPSDVLNRIAEICAQLDVAPVRGVLLRAARGRGIVELRICSVTKPLERQIRGVLLGLKHVRSVIVHS